MPLVFSTLRVLTFALGLFFVYLAAFTYETTDARVRNTLEDLWLKLEYGPRTPAGVAKRLVRVVLSLMDAIFDRVFGAGVLSIRTLAVAACYAYGAMAVSWIPVLSFLALVADVNVDPFLDRLPLTAQGYLIVGIAVVVVGTLPAVHTSLRWVTYLTATLILTALPVGVWALMTGRVLPDAGTGERLTASLASVFALPYGIAVIHVIRLGVAKSVRQETTRRDLRVGGGLLAIALVAFAALLSVAVIARSPRGQLTVWLASLLSRRDVFDLLFYFGGVLAPWGAALLIAVALSFVVLIHVTLWPAFRFFLMKTVYAAQRHYLINQKKTLWSIGLALVVSATPPAADLVMKVIEALR